jgi:serine/threonine protein kinase
MVIHRDLKPANIGFCFNGIDSEVFLDEEKAADFLKNFEFVKGEKTYHVKFFDLGMSETVDENGFGST